MIIIWRSSLKVDGGWMEWSQSSGWLQGQNNFLSRFIDTFLLNGFSVSRLLHDENVLRLFKSHRKRQLNYIKRLNFAFFHCRTFFILQFSYNKQKKKMTVKALVSVTWIYIKNYPFPVEQRNDYWFLMEMKTIFVFGRVLTDSFNTLTVLLKLWLFNFKAIHRTKKNFQLSIYLLLTT